MDIAEDRGRFSDLLKELNIPYPKYGTAYTTDEAIEVAAEASDADSGYLAFVVYQPDVTVLDLSMPGVSGLSLLQKIMLRDDQAKVLICSMYGVI
jgi:DNA-binding NarL/FixJ family response regulator